MCVSLCVLFDRVDLEEPTSASDDDRGDTATCSRGPPPIEAVARDCCCWRGPEITTCPVIGTRPAADGRMKGRVWGDLFRVEGATFVLNMFKFAFRFDEHIVFRIYTFSLLCGHSHLFKVAFCAVLSSALCGYSWQSVSVWFSFLFCADVRTSCAINVCSIVLCESSANNKVRYRTANPNGPWKVEKKWK